MIRSLRAVAAAVALLCAAPAMASPPYTSNLDGAVKALTDLQALAAAPPAPTGAATSANQVSTQAPVAPATATATTSTLVGCNYTSTRPTATSTQQLAENCDSRGAHYNIITAADSTNTADVSVPNGDGQTAKVGVATRGQNEIYNGSTWDRIRGIVDGSNTTGTGISAAGVMAECDDASIAAISEGSFGNARVSCVNHALVTRPFETQANSWSYAAAASGIVNTATAVTFKASAGTGLKNCISSIDYMSEALGTATELAIRDGAGGTVLWRAKISTAGVTGGRSISFASPICGSAATLMEVVTLTASSTGAVYFNAQGFITP